MSLVALAFQGKQAARMRVRAPQPSRAKANPYASHPNVAKRAAERAKVLRLIQERPGIAREDLEALSGVSGYDMKCVLQSLRHGGEIESSKGWRPK